MGLDEPVGPERLQLLQEYRSGSAQPGKRSGSRRIHSQHVDGHSLRNNQLSANFQRISIHPVTVSRNANSDLTFRLYTTLGSDEGSSRLRTKWAAAETLAMMTSWVKPRASSAVRQSLRPSTRNIPRILQNRAYSFASRR